MPLLRRLVKLESLGGDWKWKWGQGFMNKKVDECNFAVKYRFANCNFDFRLKAPFFSLRSSAAVGTDPISYRSVYLGCLYILETFSVSLYIAFILFNPCKGMWSLKLVFHLLAPLWCYDNQYPLLGKNSYVFIVLGKVLKYSLFRLSTGQTISSENSALS